MQWSLYPKPGLVVEHCRSENVACQGQHGSLNGYNNLRLGLDKGTNRLYNTPRLLETKMPYRQDHKPDRIFMWLPGDLKPRLRTAVAREMKRTGYPITMSGFIRRAITEALTRVEKEK